MNLEELASRYPAEAAVKGTCTVCARNPVGALIELRARPTGGTKGRPRMAAFQRADLCPDCAAARFLEAVTAIRNGRKSHQAS